MLNRLLNLAAALLLACASTGVHGYARPLQPETAHRGFATAAQGAHRDQANVTPEAASENSPAIAEASDGRRFYAKARYYGAGRGSFISVDPWDGDATSPVSLNKYLYGYANPGVYVDPDGRCAGPLIIPCAAAAATAGTWAIEYARARWFGTPQEQQRPAATATASTAYALETTGTAVAATALVVQTGGTVVPLASGLMQGGRTGLSVALLQNAPRVAATADDIAYTVAGSSGANTPPLAAPLALGGAQAIDAIVGAARPTIRYRGEAPRVAAQSDVPDVAAQFARVADGQSKPLEVVEGRSGTAAFRFDARGLSAEQADRAVLKSIRRASGARGNAAGEIVATSNQTQFILEKTTAWRRNVHAAQPGMAALSPELKGTYLHSSVQRRVESLNIEGLAVNQRLYGASQYTSPATGVPYEYRIPDFKLGSTIYDIKPSGTPLAGPQYEDFKAMGGTTDVRWIEYRRY